MSGFRICGKINSNRANLHGAGNSFATTGFLPPPPDSPPQLPRLFRHRSDLELRADGFTCHSSIFANRSSMLKRCGPYPSGGPSRRDRASSGLKCPRPGLGRCSSLLNRAPRSESTAPPTPQAAPRNGTVLRRFQNPLRRFLFHRARFL